MERASPAEQAEPATARRSFGHLGPLAKMRAHHLLHRLGLQRIHRSADDASVASLRRRLLLDAGTTVVLDVGASGGQYGSLLRAVGFTGSIVSYEPQADAFDVLAARARRDDAWEVHRCALADHAGAATLHVSGNSQSSSLLEMLPAHSAADPRSATTGTVEVELRRFRDELERHARPGARSYVKLDVQGGELSLLHDLDRDAVEGVVGFEVELSFVPLYRDGGLAEDVIARLRALGFSPAAIEPNFVDAATGRVLQVDAVFAT